MKKLARSHQILLPLCCLFLFHLNFSAWCENRQQDKPINREESFEAPWIKEPPVLDGILSDEVWKNALSFDKLWWAPKLRNYAQERTKIFIAHDKEYLYFGLECFDSQPDKIHAEQTKRDAFLESDDWVGVYLDTYHNHRDFSRFLVNPIGTQKDYFAGERSTKIQWKGDWRAAAKITETGWTAEIAIPFQILNYSPGQSAFGINFSRHHHRTDEQSWWVNPGEPVQPERFPDLILQLPQLKTRKSATLLAHTLTMWEQSNIDSEGQQSRRLEAGVNLKWTPTNALTGIMTLNPDFGAVEQDVESLDFSFFERFLSDRRPFFQEGANFFQLDAGSLFNLFFSRNRITDFDWGIKAFGKVRRFNVGFLNVNQPGKRNDLVLKNSWDILTTKKSQANGTLFYSQRNETDFDNRLLGLEGSGRWKDLGARLLWSKSSTTALEGEDGLVFLAAQKATPSFTLNPYGLWTGKNYRASDGWTPLLGVLGGGAAARYELQLSEGILQHFRLSSWFDRFSGSEQLIIHRGFNIKFILRNRVGFASGVSLDTYPGSESRLSTISFSFGEGNIYQNARLQFRFGEINQIPYRLFGGSLKYRLWRVNVNGSFEYVQHQEKLTQTVFSFNYELTREIGLSGRLVQRGVNSNIALSYRQVLRRGFDLFLIFGDPNASETRKRFWVKVVYPFQV